MPLVQFMPTTPDAPPPASLNALQKFAYSFHMTETAMIIFLGFVVIMPTLILVAVWAPRISRRISMARRPDAKDIESKVDTSCPTPDAPICRLTGRPCFDLCVCKTIGRPTLGCRDYLMSPAMAMTHEQINASLRPPRPCLPAPPPTAHSPRHPAMLPAPLVIHAPRPIPAHRPVFTPPSPGREADAWWAQAHVSPATVVASPAPEYYSPLLAGHDIPNVYQGSTQASAASAASAKSSRRAATYGPLTGSARVLGDVTSKYVNSYAADATPIPPAAKTTRFSKEHRRQSSSILPYLRA